tara:strand:- start:23 stop:538 length:516 start_codon:yes stop_codon:yes gene_type:complete
MSLLTNAVIDEIKPLESTLTPETVVAVIELDKDKAPAAVTDRPEPAGIETPPTLVASAIGKSLAARLALPVTSPWAEKLTFAAVPATTVLLITKLLLDIAKPVPKLLVFNAVAGKDPAVIFVPLTAEIFASVILESIKAPVSTELSASSTAVTEFAPSSVEEILAARIFDP